MSSLTKFILSISIQFLIIFFIIIFKLFILTNGAEVLLKIEPVDPINPLRGDYITFQYSNISNLNQYDDQGREIKNGDIVYVILRQGQEYWELSSVSKSKPKGGQLYLAGRVESGGVDSLSNKLPNQDPLLKEVLIHVVYGVEQYFVAEGKGRDFSFSDKEASAKIFIDNNGNGVLKHIYIDSKIWP